MHTMVAHISLLIAMIYCFKWGTIETESNLNLKRRVESIKQWTQFDQQQQQEKWQWSDSRTIGGSNSRVIGNIPSIVHAH